MKTRIVLLMFAILMSFSLSADPLGKKEVKKQKYANGYVVLYDDNSCRLILNNGDWISLNIDDQDQTFDVKDFSISNGVIKIISTDGHAYVYDGMPDVSLTGDSYVGRFHMYQVHGDGSREYVQLVKADR